MGRSTSLSKGLNKGAWTEFEDKILVAYIKIHGEGKWKRIPKYSGLKRSGKSCRFRWLNYLKPGIKRGNFSHDEEDLIIKLHNLLGNRWSLIAGRLPGRTDNEIKNYWNTNLRKKVQAKPTSSPCKSGPPLMAEEAPPQTEIFRTKAFKCTTVHIPPQHDNTQILTTNTTNSELFQGYQNNLMADFGDEESLMLNYPDSSFLHFGYENFQVSDNGIGDEKNNICNSSIAFDYWPFFEEEMLKDFMGNDGSLDFGSWGSFLDLEEWL